VGKAEEELILITKIINNSSRTCIKVRAPTCNSLHPCPDHKLKAVFIIFKVFQTIPTISTNKIVLYTILLTPL